MCARLQEILDFKVLVIGIGVRLSLGTWRFPSGRVEMAEPLLDAAIRELREETGINPGGFKIFMIPLPLVRDKIPEGWHFRET